MLRSDLESQLFVPVLPGEYCATLSDGTSLEDKLQEWRVAGQLDTLLAQLLPQPFASLVARGHFHTTLASVRINCIRNLFSNNALGEEWVASSRALHMEVVLFLLSKLNITTNHLEQTYVQQRLGLFPWTATDFTPLLKH